MGLLRHPNGVAWWSSGGVTTMPIPGFRHGGSVGQPVPAAINPNQPVQDAEIANAGFGDGHVEGRDLAGLEDTPGGPSPWRWF